MSALALILTAAMAIPATGPEREAGEIIESQGLDLSGEWEGLLRNVHGVRSRFRWSKGESVVIDNQGQAVFAIRESFADEGNGKLRLRINEDRVYLGIYRQDGDFIAICVSDKQYPATFRRTETQALITLHRVKPRK